MPYMTMWFDGERYHIPNTFDHAACGAQFQSTWTQHKAGKDVFPKVQETCHDCVTATCKELTDLRDVGVFQVSPVVDDLKGLLPLPENARLLSDTFFLHQLPPRVAGRYMKDPERVAQTRAGFETFLTNTDVQYRTLEVAWNKGFKPFLPFVDNVRKMSDQFFKCQIALALHLHMGEALKSNAEGILPVRRAFEKYVMLYGSDHVMLSDAWVNGFSPRFLVLIKVFEYQDEHVEEYKFRVTTSMNDHKSYAAFGEFRDAHEYAKGMENAFWQSGKFARIMIVEREALQ